MSIFSRRSLLCSAFFVGLLPTALFAADKPKEIRIDCDGDALLLQCDPVGPTCHTNETSCFYRTVSFDGVMELAGDGVAAE